MIVLTSSNKAELEDFIEEMGIKSIVGKISCYTQCIEQPYSDDFHITEYVAYYDPNWPSSDHSKQALMAGTDTQ